MQKEEQVSFLAEKIRQADAVLIGGGSGLSSAAGYNHYHWLPYMEECLQDFKEWYGLKSPFDGFYYCYSSPEQQWAYYARYIQSMWDAPTGQPYYDLRDIVAEKEVFVLTTNIDMQFERIFQKERICDYQGNSGWEMTYKNEKVFYACLNQKKSSAPEHIKDKGIYIAGDLAETLRDLKENIVGKEM